MRTERWFRKKEGFTIIEVMFAAFISAVTIVGVIMGFSRGLTLVEEVKELSGADRLAQEKMEELREGEREIPPSGSPTIIYQDPYQVTIAATAAQPSIEALTRVTVTVEWDSHTGRSLSRALSAYFAKNGLTGR